MEEVLKKVRELRALLRSEVIQDELANHCKTTQSLARGHNLEKLDLALTDTIDELS